MSDYNTEAIQGVPLLIDVIRLSAGTYSVVFTNTVLQKLPAWAGSLLLNNHHHLLL